jgi:phage gpG-like protein
MADLRDLEMDLKSQMDALNMTYEFHSVVGNELANMVIHNLESQSYDTGSGSIPFKERSRKANRVYDKNPFYRGTPYSSKNKILIQSRSLLRSIGFKASRTGVQIGVMQRTNSIHGSDVGTYARQHNEGLNARWKVIRKTISLPKRQFMPTPQEAINPKMEKKILEIWQRSEQKIFRKFSRV